MNKEKNSFESKIVEIGIFLKNSNKERSRSLHSSLTKESNMIRPGKEKTLPNANDMKWASIQQSQKESLGDLLMEMVTTSSHPNVEILIDDHVFHCHIMVLQCYSEFFREITEHHPQIELPKEKISPRTFSDVYAWMLESSPKVKRDNILDIYEAAQFLRIKTLTDQCWACFDDETYFNENAAFVLFMEARKFQQPVIQKLMLTRICKFFLTLVASKDYLTLSHKEIAKILKLNSIGVNCELEVFLSAIRWINFDWNQRKEHVVEIVGNVRFGLIPPWILVALMRDTNSPDTNHIVTFPQIKEMIENGLSYGTTGAYFHDNPKLYMQNLEKFKLTVPVPRQWIIDPNCPYHNTDHSANNYFITYKEFFNYLQQIRNFGPDHWKSLKFKSELKSKK